MHRQQLSRHRAWRTLSWALSVSLFCWLLATVAAWRSAEARDVSGKHVEKSHGTTASSERREIVDNHFGPAMDALAWGQYAAAIKSFSDSIGVNPQNAIAYAYRGICYSNLRKYDEALADLNTAVTLGPCDLIYRSRGEGLLILGRYRDAVSDFDRALGYGGEVFPSPTREDKAIALLALGENGKALSELNYCVKKCRDVESLYWRARVKFKMKDEAGALADLKQAREHMLQIRRQNDSHSGLPWVVEGHNLIVKKIDSLRTLIDQHRDPAEADREGFKPLEYLDPK